MPKTCWSSLNRRHFLSVGAAVLAAPVVAQTTVLNPCAPPRILEAHQAARDSWPIVLRNAFGALGQSLEGLEASVAFEPNVAGLFEDCTPPDILTDLKRGPDGRTSGIVITANPSGDGEFLHQRVFFDVMDLQDWTYQPPNTAWVFGNFTTRKLNQSGGTHAEPLRFSFHGSRLPTGWE